MRSFKQFWLNNVKFRGDPNYIDYLENLPNIQLIIDPQPEQSKTAGNVLHLRKIGKQTKC